MNATVLRKWYSSSLKVWDGATTIDSPVWIPNGSIFSILHTAIQLSAISLTISYSTSFHPLKLLSIITWVETLKAFSAKIVNSSELLANPEPRPPKAYADLRRTG